MPLTTSNQPAGADGGEIQAREEGGRITILPTALWQALDAEAEIWSQETDIASWIAKMSSDDRSREKLDAIVRLCFEEGFYRGAMAAKDGRSINDSLQDAAALASTARAGAGDWATPDAIEAMAEHLLEEEYEGWTWPGHEDDDGYRGGGYVRLAPPDIQARLREKAERVLGRAQQISEKSSRSVAPAVPASPISTGEEEDQGASFGPGYSAEPEPVPVSALTGEYPSRKHAAVKAIFVAQFYSREEGEKMWGDLSKREPWFGVKLASAGRAVDLLSEQGLL